MQSLECKNWKSHAYYRSTYCECARDTIRVSLCRVSQSLCQLRQSRPRSGKIMVTGASNGELFVWDVNTWEVTDILEVHTMGVLDVQMNDKWIVSCSKDTSIRVWRRDTKEAYRVLQGHRGPVNAIQLHDDKICSASGDSLAKLWNIETGQVVRVFKGHERGLACVQ